MFGFSRIVDKISCTVGRLDSYVVLPMIFLIAYATCKRYFFSNMPGWGYDIPIFLYGAHFMLGGAWTQYSGKHVNVDIINKFVSEKTQRRLSAFSNCVVFLACLVVVVYSTGWAWESTLINEKSVHQTQFNPSIWWFKWFVPVSFLFVALQSLSNVIKLISNKSSSSEG